MGSQTSHAGSLTRGEYGRMATRSRKLPKRSVRSIRQVTQPVTLMSFGSERGLARMRSADLASFAKQAYHPVKLPSARRASKSISPPLEGDDCMSFQCMRNDRDVSFRCLTCSILIAKFLFCHCKTRHNFFTFSSISTSLVHDNQAYTVHFINSYVQLYYLQVHSRVYPVFQPSSGCHSSSSLLLIQPARQSCRKGYIFFFFLMVDFLAPIAQTLMEQSSPKLQDWQRGVRAYSPH